METLVKPEDHARIEFWRRTAGSTGDWASKTDSAVDPATSSDGVAAAAGPKRRLLAANPQHAVRGPAFFAAKGPPGPWRGPRLGNYQPGCPFVLRRTFQNSSEAALPSQAVTSQSAPA